MDLYLIGDADLLAADTVPGFGEWIFLCRVGPVSGRVGAVRSSAWGRGGREPQEASGPCIL